MPRGRKPLAPPEKIDVPINEHAVRQSAIAISEDAKRLAKIDALYGDGKVYSRQRIVVESRGLTHVAGEAMLELGKRLILLKEHEPHGEFLNSVNEIGIEITFVKRAMKAAVKFCVPKGAAPHLFAGIGQTKLIELLVLDDEEIADLGKGGTVAGLTLDEIDRMSTRELRSTIRKERQKRQHETEASERLIADKNKKLDELARIKPLPEALTELQIECAKASGAAIGALQRFTQIRLAATDLLNGDARDRNDDIVRGAIGATHLQLLWQLQAWLTEEMQFAEMVFGGTKIEIRARDERGPELTGEEIGRLKDAGAEEATRVVQLAKAGANN